MWTQKKFSLPGYGRTFASKEAWLQWCNMELQEANKPDHEVYNFYTGDSWIQRKMLGKTRHVDKPKRARLDELSKGVAKRPSGSTRAIATK